MFPVICLGALEQVAHLVQLVLELLVLIEYHTELTLQHLVLTATSDPILRKILELKKIQKFEIQFYDCSLDNPVYQTSIKLKGVPKLFLSTWRRNKHWNKTGFGTAPTPTKASHFVLGHTPLRNKPPLVCSRVAPLAMPYRSV